MTEENYGKIWCLDPCYPIGKCNLIDEKCLNRYNFWVNLRPKFVNEKISKGSRIDHRIYLLQHIKAKYFSKLNEEGYNEDLH